MKAGPLLTVALLIGGLSPADARAQAIAAPVAGDAQVAQGHTGHSGQAKPKPETKPKEGDPTRQDPHAGHAEPTDVPKEPIPPLTDADRVAAFPDVAGHAVHDRAFHAFVLFDELEWQFGDGGAGASWDNKGWVGGDINRFWFRTEGEGEAGSLHAAQAHALYGRAIGRWWDLVVGIRQDVRPGSPQTWAAVGIQGLAPYWFEVEATAYVGAEGRTHARLETEYEVLLTNRLILQPVIEAEIYGRSDPERQIGAGLSTAEAGVRVRYEVRREFAPYVGVTWSRKFSGTADFARESGEEVSGARLALGTRVWF